MYAIIGATGNVGSKVAEGLLERREKVRVIGRDAEKLRTLVIKGADAAVGSLNDSDFLTDALSGVEAVFAMIPPNNSAVDFRSYQNEIGRNITNAITKCRVRYVVNLSSQGADLPAGTGLILGLCDQEKRLNWLVEVNVLHLRCTYFMENLLMSIPLINQRGVAGSALRGDQMFAMIATRDIADRVIKHLIEFDYSGKIVKDLLGQRDVSLEEAFAIIGRKIGLPELKYVQLSYDEVSSWMEEMRISPDVRRQFIEMNMALNNGQIAVNRLRTTENTTQTTIENFANDFLTTFEASALKNAA